MKRRTFLAMLAAVATARGKPAMHPIGLGTWQTFDIGAANAHLRAELLDTFYALGGRLIDSSPMYGSSEEVVGKLQPERFFIATKVWTRGRQAGIDQMNDSLRKLGHVDLMQVHNLVDVETHLQTLKDRKLARYVGVTHYHASGHEALARILEKHPVDFVQLNYSVAEREAEQRLLPLAQERGIQVLVNRPFQSGLLLQRLRTRPLPGVAKELQCSSWAQLLLKWVISHPAVTYALPATSKVAHLRDNMQAGHGPVPDTSLRAEIERASR